MLQIRQLLKLNIWAQLPFNILRQILLLEESKYPLNLTIFVHFFDQCFVFNQFNGKFLSRLCLFKFLFDVFRKLFDAIAHFTWLLKGFIDIDFSIRERIWFFKGLLIGKRFVKSAKWLFWNSSVNGGNRHKSILVSQKVMPIVPSVRVMIWARICKFTFQSLLNIIYNCQRNV